MRVFRLSLFVAGVALRCLLTCCLLRAPLVAEAPCCLSLAVCCCAALCADLMQPCRPLPTAASVVLRFCSPHPDDLSVPALLCSITHRPDRRDAARLAALVLSRRTRGPCLCWFSLLVCVVTPCVVTPSRCCISVVALWLAALLVRAAVLGCESPRRCLASSPPCARPIRGPCQPLIDLNDLFFSPN